MCVAIFSSADDDVCCVFAIFIIGALVNKLVHIQHEKVFPGEKKKILPPLKYHCIAVKSGLMKSVFARTRANQKTG